MSDAQSDGAEMTRAGQIRSAYLEALARLLETGGAVRRHRGLRETAAALDDALRIPDNQGYAVKLPDLVAKLRAGDRMEWHRLLQQVDAAGNTKTYDRLLAISPFRGMTLLFVEHWRSGNVSLSGPFVTELAKRLKKHRKHDDEYREEFLLALAPLAEIAPHQVSRLPRQNDD